MLGRGGEGLVSLLRFANAVGELVSLSLGVGEGVGASLERSRLDLLRRILGPGRFWGRVSGGHILAFFRSDEAPVDLEVVYMALFRCEGGL